MEELKNKMLKDFSMLGLPTDFELDLRGYSKVYNGRYYVQDKRIVLYTQEEDGSFIDYEDLFRTLLHESVHHYQWHYDPTFTRVKGVMHNPDFWYIYNKNVEKAINLDIVKGDYSIC